MKVYITLKKGEESPSATTNAIQAGENIGVSARTVKNWIVKHGMYAGKRGKIWLVEVEKIKGRGKSSF